MLEVIAVFDLLIRERIDNNYTDIKFTRVQKISEAFCQQIDTLLKSEFKLSEIYTDVNTYEFRYFKKSEEIQFLTSFYKLNQYPHYCTIPESKDYQVFEDLKNYFLKLELLRNYMIYDGDYLKLNF